MRKERSGQGYGDRYARIVTYRSRRVTLTRQVFGQHYIARPQPMDRSISKPYLYVT